MFAHVTQRDFELPALDEPFDNLKWGDLRISTEQRLGFEFTQWVAHNHPANRDGGMATMKPDGGTTRDLIGLLSFTIPIAHDIALPPGVAIRDDGDQGLVIGSLFYASCT
jgi:hypothetical protein